MPISRLMLLLLLTTLLLRQVITDVYQFLCHEPVQCLCCLELPCTTCCSTGISCVVTADAHSRHCETLCQLWVSAAAHGACQSWFTTESNTCYACCHICDASASCCPEPDSQLRPNKVCCVQTALKVLGLDVCCDTIVGDQLRRGISGGQKKRVTSGT